MKTAMSARVTTASGQKVPGVQPVIIPSDAHLSTNAYAKWLGGTSVNCCEGGAGGLNIPIPFNMKTAIWERVTVASGQKQGIPLPLQPVPQPTETPRAASLPMNEWKR